MISPHSTNSTFFCEQCFSFFFSVWENKSSASENIQSMSSFWEFPRHLLLFRLKIKWLEWEKSQKLSCYWHITRIKCFTSSTKSFARLKLTYITPETVQWNSFIHWMNTRREKKGLDFVRFIYSICALNHVIHIHRHSEFIRCGITYFFVNFVVTEVFPNR